MKELKNSSQSKIINFANADENIEEEKNLFLKRYIILRFKLKEPNHVRKYLLKQIINLKINIKRFKFLQYEAALIKPTNKKK